MIENCKRKNDIGDIVDEENLMKNLNIVEVQKYLSNKYPVLLIDCIEEVLPGKYAKGYKNFTYNEWFFPGHFADEPNVPGFVQIEALMQVFLMTFLTCQGGYKGKKTADAKLNNVVFKRIIVPGERLDIEATLNSFRHGMAKGHVESNVNGEKACSMDLVVCIPEIFKASVPKH